MSILGLEDDEETYSHTARCPNCHEPNYFQIPKGVTIRSYMSRKTCNSCGCSFEEPDMHMARLVVTK
jgi:hypothetical protein